MPVDGDGIAGDAGLRPGQLPVFAQQRVHQGRFADIGPADDGKLQHLGRFRLIVRQGFELGVDLVRDHVAGALRMLADRVVEFAQALAMLGGDRHRLAQPQAERLAQPGDGGAALAFVGDQDDRRLGLAQAPCEMLVQRRDAGARVDQQQRHVGFLDRRLGLLAHARFEGFVERLFQPGGVDHGEIEIAQMRRAEPPVAGHPGLIVDQRKLLADQPVEQGRFADIGPADDGDGQAHAAISAQSDARCRTACRLSRWRRPAADRRNPARFACPGCRRHRARWRRRGRRSR